MSDNSSDKVETSNEQRLHSNDDSIKPQEIIKNEPTEFEELAKESSNEAMAEDTANDSAEELHKVSEAIQPESTIEDDKKEIEIKEEPEKDDSNCSEVQGAAACASSNDENIYSLKWISFNSKETPIVLQNRNGQCPLIAIANILLLRNKMKLPDDLDYVTNSTLIHHIGDALFNIVPDNVSEEIRLNLEKNISDGISLLDRLQYGLDVNVKFKDVRQFEYTSELNVFDIFGINLYHGWIVDKHDVALYSLINDLSYNQLVEKIINLRSSTNSDDTTKAIVLESFLNDSASQMTYCGLTSLHECIEERELAILFRNNHFSVVYKNQDKLFQSVTDEGFLTRKNVVWETMENIDGNGDFYDSNFKRYKEENGEVKQYPKPVAHEDDDYLLALKLSEQEAQENHRLSDEELARALQEKEQERAQQARSQSQPDRRQGQKVSHPQEQKKKSEKKSDDCAIL